jgi:acyl dehydratase
MAYFEDIRIGDSRELGSFTFTAENIKTFAAQFDPQPFHLDEEAGRRSHFGGLSASGWHVAAAYMKLTVANIKREVDEAIARGETPVPSGPSPGFRELKWLKPVLAGDTLRFGSEIVAKRELASRPEWGLVNMYNTGTNQRGELAFSFMASVFMSRRPA